MARKQPQSAFEKKVDAVTEVNPAIYEAGIDASLKDPSAFIDAKLKPPEYMETLVSPHIKLRQDIEEGNYELSDLPEFDVVTGETDEEAVFGVTDRAQILKYKDMEWEDFEFAVAIGEVGRWWYRRAAWLYAMSTKPWDVYLDLNRDCAKKHPKVTYKFMVRMWDERDWVLCALFKHYNRVGFHELLEQEKQRLIVPALNAVERGTRSKNEQVAVASANLVFKMTGQIPVGTGASATATATATANVVNMTFKRSEAPEQNG